MQNDSDRRIVVEIFSHEEAARLRAEMQQLKSYYDSEIQRLERRIQGLHRTVYECIDTIGELRNRSGTPK